MQTPFEHSFSHPSGKTVEDMVFPLPRDWSDLPRAEKTRMGLMFAAAGEIYERGYHRASLSDILEKAGATKGALYHHFTDKHALGLEAMGHFLRTDMEELWLAPFRESDDPATTLINLIGFMHTSGVMEAGMKFGCPLVNLTEEMSGKDEGFRKMLAKRSQEWREVMEAALRRGQVAGNVREDIDPEGVSMLILAVRHGVLSQAKTLNDPTMLGKCAAAFFEFLSSLRPKDGAQTN